MLKGVKWTGILIALGSAVSAFIIEVNKQKDSKLLLDMDKRITALEQRGAE